MPPKLTHERAEAEIRKFGSEPLEKYPGLNSPWRLRCEACDAEFDGTLKYARRYEWAHPNCPEHPKRTRKLPEDVVRAVMIAAGLVPLVPYTDSKTAWRCLCLATGKEVSPHYNDVQQRGHVCRWCGVERRRRTRMHDPIEMAAAYVRYGGIPEGPYPGVDEPWPGTCADTGCGRRLDRTWRQIERSRYFCTYCSGRRIDPEEAFAAMIAAGATPLDPYRAVDVRWRCQCRRCFRTIYPRYDSIEREQTPCAYCAGRKVDPAEARQLLIDAGVMPLGPFPGADTPWPSVCLTCNNETQPRYNNVRRNHHPCWFCSGNRISAEEALALVTAAQLAPMEDFQAATAIWLCRCLRCDTPARTVLTRLKYSGARGCPVCARGGFRLLEPAQVYLVHHAELDVYKIGVTNQFDYRIREHRRHEFVPLQLPDGAVSVWPVVLGEHALAVEDEVKRLWRAELRLPEALTREDMPQKGQTETARLTPDELELTLRVLRQALQTIGGDLAVAAQLSLF